MVTSQEISSELQKLVAFQPVTSSNEGLQHICAYLAEELAALGLQVEQGEHNGFPFVLAGTANVRRSKVLLQAHVDVVPAEPHQFAVQEREGRLYGRGVYDMLYAAAAYLVLLRELHDSGELSQLNLGLMFTTDEEIGGFDGVGHLAPSYTCDVCILPDAGSSTEITINEKGVLQLEARIAGRAGHASRPQETHNPIPQMAALVIALQDAFPNTDLQDTTCAITEFMSGGAVNQIPHAARLSLDFRFPAAVEADTLEREIIALAEDHRAVVTRLGVSPPFSIDTSHPKFTSFEAIYREVTGSKLGQRHELGSSDANFFSQQGIPVLMFRPDGGEIHGEHEWIDLASLETFYTILKAYIKKEAI